MRARILLVTAAVVCFAAASAHATVFLPFGTGGTYNAYQYETTAATFAAAQTDALSRSVRGTAGHLVVIETAAENPVMTRVGQAPWIGFTDDAAFGGSEFGNTSGNAYPLAGFTPSNSAGTQRGEGWVWVNGAPVLYQNWNGAEPNNVGTENFAQISAAGGWNDLGAAATNQYTIEHDTNITQAALAADTSLYTVRRASGNAGSLAAANGFLAAGTLQGYATVINMMDQSNTTNFGDDDHFPGNPADAQDNFVIEATAKIVVATPGTYTFGTNNDDGFGLTIVNEIFDSMGGAAGPTGTGTDTMTDACCGDSFGTVTFATRGTFDLRFVFWENGGGETTELFIAPGSFTTFAGNGFQLLSANSGGVRLGTLTDLPEPTSVAIWSLLGLAGAGYGVRTWKKQARRRVPCATKK